MTFAMNGFHPQDSFPTQMRRADKVGVGDQRLEIVLRGLGSKHIERRPRDVTALQRS